VANRWDLVLTTAQGVPVTDLAAAGRKATFHLYDPSTVSWSMRGRDPAAQQVHELSTDVVVYRNGSPLMRGRVGASSDDLSGDDEQAQFSAVDYRGLLSRRILWETASVTYTGVDQWSILWDLITRTQALPGGNLGLSQGIGFPFAGITRDRVFDPGKKLGEAITELGAILDGFDWEIDAGLRVNVWRPRRGTQKDFVAHYAPGGGTVTKLARSVDPSNYANAVRQSGKDSTVTPVLLAASDVGTRLEGRWEDQAGNTDASTAQAVTDAAAWHLWDRSNIIPSWRATLAPGVWQGPGTLWLGDTCRLVVQSGRLNVDRYARVIELSVDIGDDGSEVVDVTFDRPFFSLSAFSFDPGRLDRLERR
jgi:hypothetical protein